jgi:hypothetical protein
MSWQRKSTWTAVGILLESGARWQRLQHHRCLTYLLRRDMVQNMSMSGWIAPPSLPVVFVWGDLY